VAFRRSRNGTEAVPYSYRVITHLARQSPSDAVPNIPPARRHDPPQPAAHGSAPGLSLSHPDLAAVLKKGGVTGFGNVAGLQSVMFRFPA
jgi:hypothetical protein